MRCPTCGYEGLNVDLDNNFASCEYCGDVFEELDADEFWESLDEETTKELEALIKENMIVVDEEGYINE